jgi:hypothetical protein
MVLLGSLAMSELGSSCFQNYAESQIVVTTSEIPGLGPREHVSDNRLIEPSNATGQYLRSS